MKKIFITGSLISIYLLSFTAMAQSALEDCLARNKDPEHGETACYSQFIKQAQQKGKDKFQSDLQKNTSDNQAAIKKANDDQQKQLQNSNNAQTATSGSTTTTRAPTSTSSSKSSSSSSQQQPPKTEEEQPTRSIPYY